ncbi:hypothetical protein D3C84_1121820 [compost metagenome]
MVHLRILARLSQRICFIDEQDDGATRTAVARFELFSLLNGVVEGCRYQLSHFTDPALPAGREAQREKRDVDFFLPGNRITDCLGKLGFSAAHIARKDD